MSVYIKNITKERAERCLQFARSGWCIEEIPKIIEIPSHGDLIDADKLIELCDIMEDKCDGIGASMIWHQFKTTVELFPIVISAEGSE